MKTYYIEGFGIFPIAGITTTPPMNFNQSICNYTQEGRKLIHNNLQFIDYEVLRYLIENPVQNQTTEYNDNRISLYVGQNGLCVITGEFLEIGNMEVHHKIPKSQQGTDEYKNLIYVKYNIHKLIHSTKPDTIQKYLNKENLDKKALKKLNVLRKKVGNHII